MQVTKYGHCCLLIEIQGVRFLTDPGTFSTIPEICPRVDYVVITHEHADHVHVSSLKTLLQQMPETHVITNTAVGALLSAEHIPYIVHESGHTALYKGVTVTGYGDLHALVHASVPQVQNTGYLFDASLFYPGDAFTHPSVSIDVLALPTAGPWMKLSEALNYACEVRPGTVIPVHDGIYARPDMMNPLIERVLSAADIRFVQLPYGEVVTF
jgi:L-ascorbate metabolism protein UlaG (beta-lactamase superfamily)